MDSMDFHSLSRRELQCLCKKNKIPANMTNIAMADALKALTNVIGIEEIGQSESTMPETPLTTRRTIVRKTATKPRAVESESTQTLTRPRRATTAKKIIKEEDTMDLSETTSVNETPASTRTGRRRVTGTSVCRKLDAQTQEVKEESKEERPVVHSYSTRRSSRLQSGQKITESVQKIGGGRKTDAVMIGVLSEEETDDVPMKSTSDAIDDVLENQGDNVMVLKPIPDAAQEDLIFEDGSSSTLVSANDSSCMEEVSSANQDLISMSKDEFSIEQSSEQQDMSNEVSSYMNDANVSEISVSEVTLISESKVENIFEDDSHADQDMSFEEYNVASDDIDNMEIKEEPAVEVTVKSPNVSSQKASQMPEASPLEEKTNALVKQVDGMRKCIEDQNAEECDIKFSFEDDSHADQDMSFGDSNVASDDLDNMEIKEEPAVEVTVKSPNVSSLETAQMTEASPLEEKTNVLVKPNSVCLMMSSLSSNQVDDMSKCIEEHNAKEYGIKFSLEDDFCDSESDVQKPSFEFEEMKETMETISNPERSIQVENQVEFSLECEKLDGVEMQEYQTTDLPVLNLTDATTVSSPVEVASKGNQVKSDDSVSVEQLENQKVDSVKCDSIANEEGVKVDSLLDDASTEEEDESDDSLLDDASIDDDESDEDDETVGDDESDDNVDEIHESPPVAGHLKIQNPVTPLKSSSAKKTASPNSKMMIKVLEDTEEESNKSGKVTLKSNSKLQTPEVAAEEKENSDNNKGESTAQKSMERKSLRKLKKMMKELKISIEEKKKTMGKEDLQVEKRLPLQKLSDNCRLSEEQK